MGQGNSAPRVSGGIPWWLIGLALLATAGVFIGVLLSSDEESIDDIFTKAVVAAQSRDREGLDEYLAVLRERGLDADRLGVLEGIQSNATVRHPRAVEQLKPYLDHEDEQLKTLALKFSAASYQSLGDAASARELHLKCIELAPDDTQPMGMLLALYSSAGAVKPAEEMARAILELDPEDVYAQEQLIFALGDAGRLDEAIEVCGPLLESEGAIASASPEVVNRYVTWLLEANRLEEAGAFVDKYKKLVTDPELRFRAFIKCGQLENVDTFLEVQTIPAEHAMTTWSRGVRALEAQNWEKAVDQLTRSAILVARSSMLFEQLEKAATNANEPALAEACRQNIDAMEELRKNKYAAANAIGENMDDPQLRLEIAEMSEQLAQRKDHDKWLRRALAVASQEQLRQIELEYSFEWPRLAMVAIPDEYIARALNQGGAANEKPAPVVDPPADPEETSTEEAPSDEESTEEAPSDEDSTEAAASEEESPAENEASDAESASQPDSVDSEESTEPAGDDSGAEEVGTEDDGSEESPVE